MKTYALNQRVVISNDYHWAKGVTGTIASFRGAGDPDALVRTVPGVKGPLHFYWVVFDVPQIDPDGDGPYQAAEINSEYLLPLLQS